MVDRPYVPAPRYKTGRDALTEEEVKTLLHNCTHLEDQALLSLAIASGMRRDDIVNVQTVNIEEMPPDPDHSGSMIQVSYWEKKRRRWWKIFIWGEAARSVLQYLYTQTVLKTPWLFPSPRDPQKHLSSRSAYNRFHRVLERAGLRKRPFHALRATCMKMCQRQGWSIEQTMELVGDSWRTVQEHYLTPSEDEMKAIAREKPIVPYELHANKKPSYLERR